jgi:putative solute:sodium symporter small subunit
MKDSDAGDEPTAGSAKSPTTDHSVDESGVRPDGGQEVEYLESEVNIFSPSTPFMRDHLRIIWTGFLAWLVIVFGPVTLTAVVPGVMTTTMPALGFPLHYFLVAIGAPGGALLLSVWYARKRDALDEQYGIGHGTATDPDPEVAAADGGTRE